MSKRVKLIMVRGLPASGKSTRAKEQVEKSNGRTKRVNKDDLRVMIDIGIYNKPNEKGILFIRNVIAKELLSSGKTVIIDDTNFAPIHEEYLRGLAKTCNADFEIHDMDTDVDLCIERDKRRSVMVGKKVIMEMYLKYVAKENTPNDKGNVIICDIDGTLARMTGRSPYDYTQVHTDVVVPQVRHLVNMYKDSGCKVIICTGRDGECMKETVQWLVDNNIRYDDLYIRAVGDVRRDSIVKKEMLDIIGKENVFAVIDDRPRVIRMRRNEGLFVFNVGSGREF